MAIIISIDCHNMITNHVNDTMSDIVLDYMHTSRDNHIFLNITDMDNVHLSNVHLINNDMASNENQ